MKNFKFKWATLLLALTATFACLSLASCGDDKDKDEPSSQASIVGTWRYDDPDGDEYTLYIFGADGKFQAISVEDGWQGTDSGAYTLKGDTLTFIFNDGDVVTLKVLLLTEKELYIIDEYEDDGAIHFYRV